MISETLNQIRQACSEGLQRTRLQADIKGLALRNQLARTPVVSHSGPVVSLTTYGARLNTVFLTIETIGQGELKPGRLILWLDNPASLNNLPVSLKRLQRRGLEVRLSENFGPHTKYYPYLESGPLADAALVTADDDVLYPKHWLSDLVAAYNDNNQIINCYRARVIQLSGSRLAPYSTWENCTSTTPSLRNCGLGVSGVIYPPLYLEFVKSAGRAFSAVCPRADDLWLHVNAVRSGYKVRQVSTKPRNFPDVPNSQAQGLFHTNLLGGENDQQAAQTYSGEDLRALLGAT